ncbi:anti-sigma factor domain-containing protein [Peribacillus tepidiphilus]|uniref:anti-sigma factor domain-containing protein n=1 Tax=Peribacillus tepidiphilus TaxID=2652445 RepID=UPI001291BA2E|nr:anti-sigma factor domain-containing protein [Peribacillus tepidiphilus]
MKKGIILEIDNEFVTLLTPEGEFLKTKREKKNYSIGEEIPLAPAYNNSFFTMTTKKAAVACIAAIMLLMFTFLPGLFQNDVYAYMTIDVNPSIELGMDDDLKVVELHGLNKEGKEVIKGISHWKNKSFDTVYRNIMTEIKQQGYMKKTKEIIVSTTVLKKEHKKKTTDQLEQQVKNNTRLEANKTLMVLETTEEERKEAKEHGISVGKYKKQILTEKKVKQNPTQQESNRQVIPVDKKEKTIQPSPKNDRTEVDSIQNENPIKNRTIEDLTTGIVEREKSFQKGNSAKSEDDSDPKEKQVQPRVRVQSKEEQKGNNKRPYYTPRLDKYSEYREKNRPFSSFEGKEKKEEKRQQYGQKKKQNQREQREKHKQQKNYHNLDHRKQNERKYDVYGSSKKNDALEYQSFGKGHLDLKGPSLKWEKRKNQQIKKGKQEVKEDD